MAKSARARAFLNRLEVRQTRSGRCKAASSASPQASGANGATVFRPERVGTRALAHFSEVEDAFFNLGASFRAYECLQGFLSPRYPPLEEARSFTSSRMSCGG